MNLARDYPNLDASRARQPGAADLIAISLYAEGSRDGAAAQFARVVTLHGTELLNLPVSSAIPPLLDVTTDRATYRLGDTLTLNVHYAQGGPPEPLDAYVGLVRPGGDFESLQIQDDGFVLIPTGQSVLPVVAGTLPLLEFSGALSQRRWEPSDPLGTWLAGALLVRAGRSPLDSANWVGVKTTPFTVSP
ncbi:MAG: hypothetical protein ACREKS_05740 [Candidatus Rokuibacteriota bacterium]